MSFEKWNHNHDITIFIINAVNMIKQNKYSLYLHIINKNIKKVFNIKETEKICTKNNNE